MGYWTSTLPSPEHSTPLANKPPCSRKLTPAMDLRPLPTYPKECIGPMRLRLGFPTNLQWTSTLDQTFIGFQAPPDCEWSSIITVLRKDRRAIRREVSDQSISIPITLLFLFKGGGRRDKGPDLRDITAFPVW